jgi:hypothetical protein
VSADINQDGLVDLAVANFGVNAESRGGNNVSLFFGRGDGTFKKHQEISSGVGASFLLLHDFNGTTWPDLIVVNSRSENFSLLTGNPSGEFGPNHHHGVGPGPHWVAVGDFNGDGVLVGHHTDHKG